MAAAVVGVAVVVVVCGGGTGSGGGEIRSHVLGTATVGNPIPNLTKPYQTPTPSSAGR